MMRNKKLYGFGILQYKYSKTIRYSVGFYEQGKLNQEGKKIFQDGTIYEGQLKDGYYEGKGRLIQIDGEIHEGEFSDFQLKGKARIICKIGKYYGNYINNQLNGYGKCLLQDGEKREGQYKNDYLDGKGEILTSNGDIYKGVFKYDNLCGEGQVIMNDGTKRIGQFDGTTRRNNSWIGQRVLNDGTTVVGAFCRNVKVISNVSQQEPFSTCSPSTKQQFSQLQKLFIEQDVKCHHNIAFYIKYDLNVILIIKDIFDQIIMESIYQGNDEQWVRNQLQNLMETFEIYNSDDESVSFYGQFKNRKLNGFGKTIRYKNIISNCAVEVVGFFFDNQLHGAGRIEMGSGTVLLGEFRYGTLDGEGVIQYGSDNYVLAFSEGQFKYNRLTGRGRQVYRNGQVHEGEFFNGDLREGEVLHSDGTQWIGEFDQPGHWFGRLVRASGQVEEGEFEWGKRARKNKKAGKRE